MLPKAFWRDLSVIALSLIVVSSIVIAEDSNKPNTLPTLLQLLLTIPIPITIIIPMLVNQQIPIPIPIGILIIRQLIKLTPRHQIIRM